MAAAYDRALDELSRAPLARFVAERNRLVAELRKHGQKDAAAKLAVRRKPTASAWAVNQLWWQERDAFDALLASAARLRRGDVKASAEHHATLASLRQRAERILRDAGHGASDAVLRRVATTLAAIAATGGFDPDRPGTLDADRDAPGFEAIGIGADAGEPSSAPDADDDDRDAGDGRARSAATETRSRRRGGAASGARSAANERTRARGAKAARDAQSTRETKAARAAKDAKGARAAEGARDAKAERAARAREREQAKAARARERAQRAAERKREREERAQRRTEQRRLERELDEALRTEKARARELAALEEKARVAREALDDARARSERTQRALAELNARS